MMFVTKSYGLGVYPTAEGYDGTLLVYLKEGEPFIVTKVRNRSYHMVLTHKGIGWVMRSDLLRRDGCKDTTQATRVA